MMIASSKTFPLASRVAISALRIPPRIFPIPGWFPVVVERLHPTLAGNLRSAEVVTHGVRMRLDLRDYIQLRIYYESHEPHQLAFFERFLRTGDVVVDVGAHVGIFTLVGASRVRPGGAVHSFEPVPANFEALEANIALNGFDNVVTNRAAVGCENGQVEMGVPDAVPDRDAATSAMYTVGGAGRTVTAPLTTLDSYAAEHLDGHEIRILKMDVEGLEPSALDGFRARLDEAPPDAIVLEVNLELLHRHGFTGGDLLDRLGGAGYEFFQATAGGRLKPFEPDLPSAFDPATDVPQFSRSPAGWLRRYAAEHRYFFNLFAVKPQLAA